LKAGRTIVAIHVDAVQKQDMEDQRAQVARFLGDISASSTGGWYSVISLHGGGSPQAMKREIFRHYPIEERRALVERLLDRGVVETGSSGAPNRQKQPGQCCAAGCQPPAGQDS
jgi:4-hydroxybutyryl-CoA dehydratase/vinylacetyl-CoA-Delta-isomerase